MKTQRLVTIDYELNIKLSKEDNASGLINSMLMKHYKDNRSEEQIIQDVKKIIKEKAKIQANKDKYTNPKHLAKREKEMAKIKAKRKNGI